MKMPLLSNESIHEVDLILIYNFTLTVGSLVFSQLSPQLSIMIVNSFMVMLENN